MKSLEQEIAKPVYDKVEAYGKVHKKGTAERDQYISMAQKLPILIRTAGLAEALAFVESRKEEAYKDFLKDVATVVSGKNMRDFAEASCSAEMQEYIYLTRRTMLALKWFKRFTESVLDPQGG